MKGILRRALACVLGALLVFGLLGIPAIAAGAGEAIAAIKAEYQVIPAQYPNPFNVPYEDFFTQYSFMHNIPYLNIIINGKKTIMIATEIAFTVNVNDFSMRTIDVLNLSNAEMYERIARIKKAVSIKPSIVETVGDFILCQEYYDYITFLPIGVLVENSIFVPNEKFFKNNEIVKIGEYIKHVEYMKNNSLDYDNLGLPEELIDRIKNNKFISSEEIFQVYFKVVPKEYWPILTESKINVNRAC